MDSKAAEGRSVALTTWPRPCRPCKVFIIRLSEALGGSNIRLLDQLYKRNQIERNRKDTSLQDPHGFSNVFSKLLWRTLAIMLPPLPPCYVILSSLHVSSTPQFPASPGDSVAIRPANSAATQAPAPAACGFQAGPAM